MTQIFSVAKSTTLVNVVHGLVSWLNYVGEEGGAVMEVPIPCFPYFFDQIMPSRLSINASPTRD